MAAWAATEVKMPLVWKIVIMAVGAVGVASTPLFWQLSGPDAGEFVGASIQAGTGVLALIAPWVLPWKSGPVDTARNTGRARGSGGGAASTGVRRPGGTGSGAASATDTGDATAHGSGSSASTGVDYS